MIVSAVPVDSGPVRQRLLGVQHIMNITIPGAEGVPLDTLTQHAAALLHTRHRIQPEDQDDFMVRARDVDVLMQFLVEAMVLSLSGGGGSASRSG